jgi:hypothetical protein
MPDIRDVLHKGAHSPSQRPKLESAWIAGRRRLWTGRLLSVVLVFAVAASGVLGAMSLLDRGEAEPPADDEQGFAPPTLDEQAAIFGIRALESVGLRSQNGLYANYRSTESLGDDRWRVEFSGPMDCSHELAPGETTTRDFRGAGNEEIDETRFADWGCRSELESPILLEVSLRDGVFSITDLTGPGRAELYEGPGRSEEAAPNHLLFFTQPQSDEPPAYELSDVEIVTDTESTMVHGTFLWTGRGSNSVFQSCEMTLLSAGGEELTSYPWAVKFSNPQWFSRSERKWVHDEVEAGELSPDSRRDGFFHDDTTGKFEDATDLELNCEPEDFSNEGDED